MGIFSWSHLIIIIINVNNKLELKILNNVRSNSFPVKELCIKETMRVNEYFHYRSQAWYVETGLLLWGAHRRLELRY